ncbi:hypothetical protein TNCV_2787701 [Trichonephila clavipes]|uniref:Uncharacterized protein n=1 Tax=Trichonephila clavipes TaxID=2585209 RepID=A0A8X6VQ45_TRICX|nr:hypothetical protein TNCV_2787701 [Trichonephila clavipes]
MSFGFFGPELMATLFQPNPRSEVDKGFSSCSGPCCCVWKKNYQANALQPSCRDCSLCPASGLVCPFDCIQQKREDICGAENISHGHHRKGERIFFSVISRNSPDKVILFESSFGEKVELLSSPYKTKIGTFHDIGILVCGVIMLGSRTPLYLFHASTVNSQRSTDEILEANMRSFSVLWAWTTFLWTKMSSHTKLTLLMNFIREGIFAIRIGPRGLQI